MRTLSRCTIVIAALAAAVLQLNAQVTSERLLSAAKEPRNWLTYSGGYTSQRYSALDQITPANVTNLEQKWVFQGSVARRVAVDAARRRRHHVRDAAARTTSSRSTPRPAGRSGSTGTPLRPTSRPAAARTTAASRFSATRCSWARSTRSWSRSTRRPARPLWNVSVAEIKAGYSMTLAPLVVKDKVIVGVGGGEFGIRGFIAAYDAKTGKELWRFYTIPAPGEPGPRDLAEATRGRHGGGSIWLTGSYDPGLNLTYWGVGNPGPDWNPEQRPGDNLYTDSVVALDPDTGKLKWHFQFTPQRRRTTTTRCRCRSSSTCDWNGAPGEADAVGEPQRLLLRAGSRDRAVPARQAVREGELGERARRARPADPDAAAGGAADLAGQPGRHQLVLAVVQSAHRVCSTSPAWENYATHLPASSRRSISRRAGVHRRRLRPCSRRCPSAPGMPALRRGPINNWTEAVGTRRRAWRSTRRPASEKWKFEMTDVTDSGILTTGVGSAVHRRPRGLLPRARCADRRAALEGEPGRPDRQPARSPTRWTASSTWPRLPA